MVGGAIAAEMLLSVLSPVTFLASDAHAAAPVSASSEESASARAVASGEPVEVLSARTEYSQTVANPDGTFTLTQSTEPQRARAADGSWRDIDVTLQRYPDGRVGPKSAVVELSFSGGGSGSGMLTAGRGEQELRLGWPGSLPAPTLNGATATYPDVLAGVDLQLTATAEGYREVLAVKTAEAAANPELEKIKLTATGDGLSVVPGAGGGVRAVDADGNAVFRGPAGRMWDSAGDDVTGSRTRSRSVRSGEQQSEDNSKGGRAQPGKGDATAELPVIVGDGSVSVEPDLELLRGEKTAYLHRPVRGAGRVGMDEAVLRRGQVLEVRRAEGRRPVR